MQAALRDVLNERQRQIAQGFTADHDDEHDRGELGYAAACYAMPYLHRQDADAPPAMWPFETEAWKPQDYRRNLVRAAALLLAEIERLDRLPSPPHVYAHSEMIPKPHE